MANEVDISERWLLENHPKAFAELLMDYATGQNIYWATESYAERGEGFGFFDPITVDKIKDDSVIRPRASKSPEEQMRRVKDKAEVFTPSWICNAQNNLVDDAWFGRTEVFNREITLPDGSHDWEVTERPIRFGKSHDKHTRRSWIQYVKDRRLEITCGEAPYLISRYDTVSGTPIPVQKRVGMLDRKLQVVSENEHTPAKWLRRAQDAIKATYGFEWQGDSLLLAREAALLSVLDYFYAKFPNEPGKEINRQKFSQMINRCAHFIACNLWQMDGLNFVLPGTSARRFELPSVTAANKWRAVQEKKAAKIKQQPDKPLLFGEDELDDCPDDSVMPDYSNLDPDFESKRMEARAILEALRRGKPSPDPSGIPAVVYDWFPAKEKQYFAALVNDNA